MNKNIDKKKHYFPITVIGFKERWVMNNTVPIIDFECSVDGRLLLENASYRNSDSMCSALITLINGNALPKIQKVIFNSPATIVIWNDGSKTIVKAQQGDTYNKELGLAMCCTKKLFGNKSNYNDQIKKFLSEA